MILVRDTASIWFQILIVSMRGFWQGALSPWWLMRDLKKRTFFWCLSNIRKTFFFLTKCCFLKIVFHNFVWLFDKYTFSWVRLSAISLCFSILTRDFWTSKLPEKNWQALKMLVKWNDRILTVGWYLTWWSIGWNYSRLNTTILPFSYIISFSNSKKESFLKCGTAEINLKGIKEGKGLVGHI